MATTRIIYAETAASPRNQDVYMFCENGENGTTTYGRKAFELTCRMAGKVKKFIENHAKQVTRHGYDYNGYGYSSFEYRYLMSKKDIKQLQLIINEKSTAKAAPNTDDEKKQAWAKRLAKLTSISIDEALLIADEKLEYKEQQIDKLVERQCSQGYSVKREKLADKLRRSNPLRRIESVEHANAILAASKRHNETPYEHNLEVMSEEAKWGTITHEQARDMARQAAAKGEYL